MTTWPGAPFPRAYNARVGRLHLALADRAMIVYVGPGGRVPCTDPGMLRAMAAELLVAAQVLDDELGRPVADRTGQGTLGVG